MSRPVNGGELSRAFSSSEARGQGGAERVQDGGTGSFGNLVANVPIGDVAALRASGFYCRIAGYIDAIGIAANDVNHARSRCRSGSRRSPPRAVAYERFFLDKLSRLPGVQEITSKVALSEIKSTNVLPI